MASHGRREGVGERDKESHLAVFSGIRLGLAVSLMLAGPVPARKAGSFKVSKLEIVQAGASAEDSLGP